MYVRRGGGEEGVVALLGERVEARVQAGVAVEWAGLD